MNLARLWRLHEYHLALSRLPPLLNSGLKTTLKCGRCTGCCARSMVLRAVTLQCASFVAAQRPVSKEVFVRIETGPGEECQVDFGTVGKLFDPIKGKLRTAYCFVMTLSHSRHMYVEFVFDQKIATWIGCHKRAFAYHFRRRG